MVVVENLKIIAHKHEILKAVSAYHDLSRLDNLNTIYHELQKLAVDKIKPIGVFQLEPASELLQAEMKSSILKKCRNLIFCAFTIGDDITEVVDQLFSEDRFDEAILLDAISTSVLFHMSKQLYDEIYEFAKAENFGLTCRVAPGDGEIDIEFQNKIIQRFERLEVCRFRIENGYIVKPYKTITYVYGADESIEINREDHHCGKCHNKNCFMRNSESKTRGSFIEEAVALMPGKC